MDVRPGSRLFARPPVVSAMPVVPFIFGCLLVWLAGVLAASELIVDTPWFGAHFVRNADGPGVRVASVAPKGPAERAGLRPGSVITAISAPGGGTSVLLSDDAGMHDRSEAGRYRQWRDARAERRRIWPLLAAGTVRLTLDDGRVITITGGAARGWARLPAGFWIGLAHSLLVLLIGAGIAAFAPSSALVGLLFLSSVWLSVNILGHAFRTAEELVYPPILSDLIYYAGNLSAPLFAFTLLAMLWYTPRPPARPWGHLPVASLAIGFALFAFVVQDREWFAFPLHPFQFPYLLAIVLALGVIAVKWLAFRGDPIARATLSWVVLSIFVAVVPWFIVYSLPIMLGRDPFLAPNLSGIILTAVFLGFALGAVRFRLFGMRTVWLWTSISIATGAGLVLVDLVLLTQLDWSQTEALPTSIVVASWAFFPIKSYLHHLFTRRGAVSPREASLDLFDHLTATSELSEIDGRLARFMTDLFQAASIDHPPEPGRDTVEIRDNGLALAFPGIVRNGMFVLHGRNRGRRLFSDGDRSAAQSLVELARRIYRQKAREFAERETDRRQIVRDLHDDVGAKILSMIYAAPEDSALRDHAGGALRALKDSLMTIEGDGDLDLAAVWAPFWAGEADRLKVAGFRLDWHHAAEGARVIRARDFVNLKRIVEEHVSNTLKYAGRAEPVQGRAVISRRGAFSLEITSGIATVPAPGLGDGHGVVGGRGMANMRARAGESGIALEVGPNEDSGRFRLSLRLPAPD